MHKKQTVGDLSSAVTGVLIAFNVPSNFPYWMAIIGCFVAIVIVKQLYGGIGRNVVNPAITARIVLFISFATEMTTCRLRPCPPLMRLPARPLWAFLRKAALRIFRPIWKCSSDLSGGSIGEVSAVALIIGGLFPDLEEDHFPDHSGMLYRYRFRLRISVLQLCRRRSERAAHGGIPHLRRRRNA